MDLILRRKIQVEDKEISMEVFFLFFFFFLNHGTKTKILRRVFGKVELKKTRVPTL